MSVKLVLVFNISGHGTKDKKQFYWGAGRGGKGSLVQMIQMKMRDIFHIMLK